MKSIKPRKQRKELFNAPIHKRRKWLAAHLEENLLLKYDKRSIPVVKGDTVKVMRGSYKGHEDKVANVNVKKRHIEIEGITITKADGKKIAKPLPPSNVLVTKLVITDKWRRKKLERGLSEETKKEIEKEAEKQIKEVKEEEIRKTEEKELEEAEIEDEVEPVETSEKPEKSPKEEKPTPESEKKEEKSPAKTEKPKAEKKEIEKAKPASPTKKKTTKKTPAKTTKKVEKEEK